MRLTFRLFRVTAMFVTGTILLLLYLYHAIDALGNLDFTLENRSAFARALNFAISRQGTILITGVSVAFIVVLTFVERERERRLKHWRQLRDKALKRRIERARGKALPASETPIESPDAPRLSDWTPLTPARSGFESYVDRARFNAEAKARKPDIEGHIANATATRHESSRRGDSVSYLTMRAVFTNVGADTTISNFGIEIRLGESVITRSELYKGEISPERAGEKPDKKLINLVECLDHNQTLGRNHHRDGHLQFIVKGLSAREIEGRDVILSVYDGAMKPHKLSGDRIRVRRVGAQTSSRREEEKRLEKARRIVEFIEQGKDLLLRCASLANPPYGKVREWEGNVMEFVKANYDEFTFLQFGSKANQRRYQGTYITDDVNLHWINTLVERLGEFLEELRPD